MKSCGICSIGACAILKYRDARAPDVEDFDEDLALRTWDDTPAIATGEDDGVDLPELVRSRM